MASCRFSTGAIPAAAGGITSAGRFPQVTARRIFAFHDETRATGDHSFNDAFTLGA